MEQGAVVVISFILFALLASKMVNISHPSINPEHHPLYPESTVNCDGNGVTKV
jgi:hypothetical protein